MVERIPREKIRKGMMLHGGPGPLVPLARDPEPAIAEVEPADAAFEAESKRQLDVKLRPSGCSGKDFDRRRIDVVGATVRAPPLLMSLKVAIDRTVVPHDQPDAEPAIQSVAPCEPAVDAAKARGSVGAKGNSARGLNLRGGMHARARGQGADAHPAAPAKLVTNLLRARNRKSLARVGDHRTSSRNSTRRNRRACRYRNTCSGVGTAVHHPEGRLSGVISTSGGVSSGWPES